MHYIEKGYLVKTSEGGKYAQVRSLTGEIIDDVLMLYPFGSSSNMEREEQEGSLVLLLKALGSKTNIFGIAYNPVLQPLLEEGDVSYYNPKNTNKITFKKNGDIEVSSETAINVNADSINEQATSTINIDAPDINLGDAVGLLLNNAAVLQVTIPGGSSAGTYPVTIVSEGQTKVKA
jgi:phage gp45-like